MAKTTELGYDLCEGKEFKLEKDTNFKVLDKFLQMGENWTFSWKSEGHFPKKEDIADMEGKQSG